MPIMCGLEYNTLKVNKKGEKQSLANSQRINDILSKNLQEGLLQYFFFHYFWTTYTESTQTVFIGDIFTFSMLPAFCNILTI